ncbi:uncharacterized protein LOC126739745 isoform X2 [Anthonomus grandis grandis]|uniref:uncharacterized protein LOC126739745 isoform X2 n=1 Tax=Anthonomus grandis grandis TaxID=2921223 RepID=UPI0021661B4A|nr:uncharacterized protein LOC126739745 isoform X2 [Anthonomus grandis grandis]
MNAVLKLIFTCLDATKGRIPRPPFFHMNSRSGRSEFSYRVNIYDKCTQMFVDGFIYFCFIAGSSESFSNEEPGTDSDSDAPLINLVTPTSAVTAGLANEGAQDILALLSNQSSVTKGPEINSDVAALLSGFLTKGIDKENRNATIDSYPCIANCTALQPPIINPEIKSCLDANALKQDNFLRKLQSQLAAGISAIAIPLDQQYEVAKKTETEEAKKELEKKCDPVKIFSDVFHALSLHRRHGIVPFLDIGVKKILDDCPIDEFLFGKSFPDQLKSSNEAQCLGSSIRKKARVPQYTTSKSPVVQKTNQPKAGPSGISTSLNYRRSQRRTRFKKEEGSGTHHSRRAYPPR